MLQLCLFKLGGQFRQFILTSGQARLVRLRQGGDFLTQAQVTRFQLLRGLLRVAAVRFFDLQGLLGLGQLTLNFA